MLDKPIKRDIVDEIVSYVGTDNIIVLHGARQVGKTHILYYLENWLKEKGELTYFVDLEEPRNVEILNKGVESFLQTTEALGGFNFVENKKTDKFVYVFIDEIQYLDRPSSFLKLLVDHHKYVKLIVSGSSSFDIKKKFTDSLVGRTVEFEIFPLSFSEFLRFKGLNYNLKKMTVSMLTTEVLASYEEYVFFGGYPKVVLETIQELKEKYLEQIIDTYVRKDIRDLARVRNIKKFNQLLALLAERSGQLLNVTKLSEICSLAKATVEKYLMILENTYVIKLVPPFSRSARVEVSKMPKVYFYDTGLMQMLWLHKMPAGMIGNVLETSVFAELVKKYKKEKIYYWRNRSQNEIDFILFKGNVALPMEVKKNFKNFHYGAMAPFLKKYKISDYRVIGLEGEKKDEHFIYPWEIGD